MPPIAHRSYQIIEPRDSRPQQIRYSYAPVASHTPSQGSALPSLPRSYPAAPLYPAPPPQNYNVQVMVPGGHASSPTAPYHPAPIYNAPPAPHHPPEVAFERLSLNEHAPLAPPPRPLVPAEVFRTQAAYGARTESLGYARKSSSLKRNFPIPRDLQEFFADVSANGRTQVIQPVCQGDDPSLRAYGQAQGLCAGMVKEWLRLHSTRSSDSASNRFGDVLNNDMGKIVGLQDETVHRTKKANKSQYKLVNPLTFMSSSSKDIGDKVKKERMEKEAAGLSFLGEKRCRIDARADAKDCAETLHQLMGKSGFYTITWKDSEGGAHIMGVHIPRGGNELKLMDPNTAEFRTFRGGDAIDLLEDNIHINRYHRDFSEFTVAHFAEK
ncbi:MAG: hypothetical protein ABW123_05100 [Cystobacter sp.]